MKKFIARTRLRGEIDYHNAIWRWNEKGWDVEFIQGPNLRKHFPSQDVAIAMEDKWKIGESK